MAVIAPVSRGTRNHDCCQVKARQPVVRHRTAAKYADKDLLTRYRFRDTPNLQQLFQPVFSMPKTTRPRSAAADRGLVRVLAESCLNAALRLTEELTHQNVRFACVTERARGDAAPIRENRALRQRAERSADKRMLVVRMHRGAHSRRE